MALWILDTDAVSLLLENHPTISQRIREVGADSAISIVTVQELFNGWIVRINNATDLEELIRLYGRLYRVVQFYSQVNVLNFDRAAAEQLTELLQNPILSKQRLQRDMRIAAIALSQNATLVTRNYRDFSQVPGLMIENWVI